MNRIYKVIWSKVKNSYIVVSEIAGTAKKAGSRTSKKTLAAFLAAGIFSIAGAGSAWADNVVVDASHDTGKNTITAGSQVTLVGTGNVANGSDNNEVFGNGNKILVDGVGSQNVGIFGALNTVTDADTMYVTGYQNTAKSIFTSSLMGWNNTLDTVVSGAVHGNQNKISKVKDVDVLGSDNTVVGVMPTDPSEFVGTVVIVGGSNKLDKSTFSSVIGSENTVENSKSQIVMGDSNTIKNRNAGTVSGKQEERTKNVLDLTIGKGNEITGNDTYMKGHESLKVIGDHNTLVNPSSSIVIGDYQTVGAEKESVIIGAMSPDEKASGDKAQGGGSVVVGYHAQSGGGTGLNVAVGRYARAQGMMGTVTGYRSLIDPGKSVGTTTWSSIYGTHNTILNSEEKISTIASSIIGTMNKVENATNSLIMGTGNKISNTKTDQTVWTNIGSMAEEDPVTELLFRSNGGEDYSDAMANTMGIYAETDAGAVSAIGNANLSEYAGKSQILGTANTLKGTADKGSFYNTLQGYGNKGTNVNHTVVNGTGNTISNSDSNIVMGDYHEVSGGTNNVILGTMKSEEKEEERTYTPSQGKSEGMPNGYTGTPVTYKVKTRTAVKAHTANISNAVMLGYNTDVTKNGGVALGAESIASIDKGVVGYDPLTKAASTETSPTWKSTAAAVSVGDAANNITRQITNVAAGTEDTDAVNIAQLKSTMLHYISINSGTGLDNWNNDGAKRHDSIAIGGEAVTGGVETVAIGSKAAIISTDTVGNSSNSAIAVGMNSKVYNSVGGIAIGRQAEVGMKPGPGTKAEDFGIAIGYQAQSSYEQGLAIGGIGVESGAYGTTVGAFSHTEKTKFGTALGYNTDVTKNGGVALGAFSVADTAKDVAGYDPAAGDHANDTTGTWKSTLAAVSVGSAGDNLTRQITNVAAGKEDTDAVNVAQLKALGTKVEKAATEAGKHTTVEAGDYVTVTEANTDGSKKYTVTGPKLESDGTVKITDKMENGKKVGYNLSVDTSKLGIADMHVKEGTASYNPDGTGSIELIHQDGTKATVTGLKDTTLKEDSNALKLTGKTLSLNIEDTSGKKVTGSVDLTAIAGQIDTNTTYTMTGVENADNTTTITLTGSDGAKNEVKVATKDTRSTVKAGENVSITDKDNEFGAKEYTINVKADGKVEQGNTGIVSGGTVYNETHVKNDGGYVKKGNSAGENLTILDQQVNKNTNSITNLGDTINNMNGKLGTLDNRISKVGAGAAALAALHPLDFDPEDKWDIAAGFGNYRNASAAAVGLFYRPNERTMMSLGWTMGDDRNMVNAGVSVKLGRGDVYTKYSKVEMAKRMEEQDKKITTMEAELEELKTQLAQLAAKK